MSLIDLECLERDEVDGNRIARKRVDDDDVVSLRLFVGHRDAGIANHDIDVGRGAAEIGELFSRYVLHSGVDVVEANVVARLAVRGDRPSAKSDDADSPRP